MLGLGATAKQNTDILSLTSSLSLGSVGLPFEEPMTTSGRELNNEGKCWQSVAVNRDTVGSRQTLARTVAMLKSNYSKLHNVLMNAAH